jgi:hypothetical protein
MLTIFSGTAQAKTQVFSDRLLSGESIDIDDFTFIITMNKYANAIFVDGGKIYQSVPLYTCKSMENFEICFDNTTYDEEDNDLYALVRISRYKPELTITKTINDTELYVGQEAEVTIKIENSEDTASQIIMTDDYPSSIEIYDMEGGCSVHENQVYWQGHLEEGKSKECKFIMRGMKELHQSFAAHLKYWDGFKWIDKYSTSLPIDFEPVVEILSSVVREDYEVDGTTFDFEEENPGINIGETLRLLVNITNKYDDDINIKSLEINLPPDLEYKSTGSLRFNFFNASGNRSSIVWYSDRIRKVNPRQLMWDGKISTNKTSKLFVMNLEAKRTGEQNIIINTKYEYDDMEFTDSMYESFSVADPGIGIRLTVDDQSRRFSAPERLDEEEDSIDLEALHPYRITVYAQNLNKYAKLQDINVKTYTELAGFKTIHYSEIEEEEQKIPYSLTIIPPQVPSSKEFKTNISIKYQNEYGERHENSTEFLITVVPSKDITIALDSSEGWVLDGGEETEVTVKVTNDRLVDIKNVEVKDEIDEGLHIEGVHAKKLKLNKETDTDAYKYKIKAPIVHNKTRYYINTTVSFFDPDSRQQMNYTESTLVTVEPLKPDVSLDLTLDKPTDIYPGTLIPVEYTITNNEELEIVRDLTINFPIQAEVDLVGPKTFFIDKLDPAEKVILKNLVNLRPKIVNDSLKLNMTRVVYYDNYGNMFDENSTEDTLDVNDARINGPALFLRTIVPSVVNKSAEGTVRIEVKNSGSDATTATIEQGGKSWELSIPDGTTKYIEYTIKHDVEGNYTIDDPVAKFSFQGIDAYTKGSGAIMKVMLLTGPAANVTVEAAPIAEAVEAPVPEKEEMSFEEYQALAKKDFTARAIKYGMVGGLIVLVLAIIVIYIYYSQKKGPSQPFIESKK